VQPKTFERFYAKPGDALDEQERVMIDVPGKRELLVDNTLFPNPYEVTRLSGDATAAVLRSNTTSAAISSIACRGEPRTAARER
jgi:hypothetical protein